MKRFVCRIGSGANGPRLTTEARHAAHFDLPRSPLLEGVLVVPLLTSQIEQSARSSCVGSKPKPVLRIRAAVAVIGCTAGPSQALARMWACRVRRHRLERARARRSGKFADKPPAQRRNTRWKGWIGPNFWCLLLV